jgi:hypothetical protein
MIATIVQERGSFQLRLVGAVQRPDGPRVIREQRARGIAGEASRVGPGGLWQIGVQLRGRDAGEQASLAALEVRRVTARAPVSVAAVR